MEVKQGQKSFNTQLKKNLSNLNNDSLLLDIMSWRTRCHGRDGSCKEHKVYQNTHGNGAEHSFSRLWIQLPWREEYFHRH